MNTFQKLAVSLGLVAAMACGGNPNNGTDDGDGGGDTTDAALIDGIPEIDARVLPPIPADCLESANLGLTWMVAQQNPDGSWGANEKVATTGFAVLKLETYAAEIGQSPFDPNFIYFNQVKLGLAFLFTRASFAPVPMQTHGNPDANGNTKGIAYSAVMYDNSIVLMAVAAGADPTQIVTTPGSVLNGLTFRAVVEDSVDYLSFAQSDAATSTASSCSRGGWRYQAFNNNNSAGDNSVTQWATLALEYARHPQYKYMVMTPDWVLTETRDWVTCIQNHGATADDGSSGYTNPTQILNAYKTGALIQQLSFLGDNPNSPNVAAAVNYIGRKWNDTSGVGWRTTNISDYLAMYSIMKGMESYAITDIGGINWYREFCDKLKTEQRVDGSWGSSRYERDPRGPSGLDSTLWALLVLERAAPPPEIIP